MKSSKEFSYIVLGGSLMPRGEVNYQCGGENSRELGMKIARVLTRYGVANLVV